MPVEVLAIAQVLEVQQVAGHLLLKLEVLGDTVVAAAQEEHERIERALRLGNQCVCRALPAL